MKVYQRNLEKLNLLPFHPNFLVQKVVLQLKKSSLGYFSFNSPYGACEECEGIGSNLNVDPKLVVPDENKSLQDGAIVPWAKSTSLYYIQTLSSLAKHYKIDLDVKWKKIPKKIQDIILYGSDEDEIKFSYDDGYELVHNKKSI